MVANGAQNIVSTFFSGFPSSGAFSRTALNSKCGVHTPLGGCKLIYIVKNQAYTKYRGGCVDWSVVIIIPVILAQRRIFIVLSSLYLLYGTAYYIPNAGLAAIIIHAILDIIASPRTTYGYAILSSCVWHFSLTVGDPGFGVYLPSNVSSSSALSSQQFLAPLRLVSIHPRLETDKETD